MPTQSSLLARTNIYTVTKLVCKSKHLEMRITFCYFLQPFITRSTWFKRIYVLYFKSKTIIRLRLNSSVRINSGLTSEHWARTSFFLVLDVPLR